MIEFKIIFELSLKFEGQLIRGRRFSDKFWHTLLSLAGQMQSWPAKLFYAFERALNPLEPPAMYWQR